MNMWLLLPCILFSTTIVAQNILPGSTLHASNLQESWTSPNKSFSLSFIQESKNKFFAAVTNNGVPVWKAGGEPGGAVDSSAMLQFQHDGNLQLAVGPAMSVVWQSNTSGLGINSATLENSGNFVLKNGDVIKWSSFDNPTDTILPEQNFTSSKVLSCGYYSLRLLSTGRMVLRWNDSVEYYSSSGINTTGNLNVSSPSLGISLWTLSLFDPLLSSPVVMAQGNDYGDAGDNTLRFVKLDCDGNLRMYSSSVSDGMGSKIMRWTAVSDQCMVFGFCGSFGVCRYDGDDVNPICECPSQNFDLIDSNDGRRGCKMKGDIQICQTTMLSLNNTFFLTYTPETDSDFYTANIRACRSNCLVDSMCKASSSMADGTGACYMKRSDFISGYHSPIFTTTSYVKVCDPALPNPPISSRNDEKKPAVAMIVALVVLASAFIIVVLVMGYLWLNYRSKTTYESLGYDLSFSDYASSVPVHFTYKKLLRETKEFKEKLGEGGFGSVYRGVLSNKTVVAVKKLEGIGQGEKQFRMEVATISSTHHLNLVRLVGFCSEGKHRLLVYEFMKNSSLDKLLFPSTSNDRFLSWAYRYNIALGTAKGMTYLHEECRDCILHCDIKPENILLDENFNAKISDFGLARLLNLNDHRQRSLITVRGTRGYLAPEWIANLPITSKSDVYSYGMVLLEIVSGRRNFDVSNETSNKRFSLWAYEQFENGNVGAVLDRRLLEDDVDMVQAMRLVKVSFWCIHEHASLRPTMGRVVQMIEGIADVVKPPPPLAMVDGSGQSSAVVSVASSSQMAAVSSLSSA